MHIVPKATVLLLPGMGSDPGLVDVLASDGYKVEVADDGTGMVAMLGARRHQAVLVDLDLPDGKGMDVLRAAVHAAGSSAVIAWLSEPSFESAVVGMRAGGPDLFAT